MLTPAPGRLRESEARGIFAQLCLAVEYLHTNNIVHRDIKAENILLDNHGAVKLADFGFGNFFSHGGMLESSCGSAPYAAPEIFLGCKYTGPEVDVWVGQAHQHPLINIDVTFAYIIFIDVITTCIINDLICLICAEYGSAAVLHVHRLVPILRRHGRENPH